MTRVGIFSLNSLSFLQYPRAKKLEYPAIFTGHEGRHAERVGHHRVLQSLVRDGHILGLDHRLSHSQLDVGRQET